MVLWTVSKDPVPYPDALDSMANRVEILREQGEEEVWLLEHSSLYTAGTSAKEADLLQADQFPVFYTGRGGQFTYHGPGQRVIYVMIDLSRRQRDLHEYIRALEQWVIDALSMFGVHGERRDGRVGIWVTHPPKVGQINSLPQESKIAAIGVRVRHWITYHGIAINVHPNLEHYKGIVPCGLSHFGVTSLHDLGIKCTLEDVDEALRQQWENNLFLRGKNE